MKIKVRTFKREVDPGYLKGQLFAFFGAVNNQFKLAKAITDDETEDWEKPEVYEVIEDENDGYRSSMEELLVVPRSRWEIFPDAPLAMVIVEHSDTPVYDYTGDGNDIWLIKDIVLRHIWLEFGTRNTNDYYPSFVFNYRPPGTER